MTLLYKSEPVRGAEWQTIFAEKMPEVPFRIWPDVGDPNEVRYLICWVPPDDLLTTFPNLEWVMSSGAGVDQFDLSVVPPQIPLLRMIEPGIVDTMVEYVSMAVLTLHRDGLVYRQQQREQVWQGHRLYPASYRRVGVLGLGRLGEAVCRKLSGFGFQTAGWSRAKREIEGVTTYAGAEQMPDFLARTDILVCLLPLTDETRGILNADLFAQLPKGAKLVNTGRGPHLDQEALLAALDNGQISGAVLDVTDPEPLPADHPLWTHPAVMITPHVASMTQPETACDAVIKNLRRHKAGQPMIGVVDRSKGY